MKSGFRQSMAWVHTWGGLSVGWILFFVFLTGTLGYFDTEIDRWMKPEMQLDNTPMAQSLDAAQQRLQEKAPGAARWFINPPTNRDTPNLRIFWELPGTDGNRGITGSEILDPDTSQPISARSTGGGQVLYRMHYALHYLPITTAYWIVGICSMFMLIAIITGVIIHKKIFKDFFTFRSHKGSRSWLDMHNLLSVIALPFHVMITYSGLIFLAFTYMPLIVASSYGTERDAQRQFFNELFAEAHRTEPANVAAPLASLHNIVQQAEDQWGSGQIRYISIYNPGDANARVNIGRIVTSPLRSTPEMVFDGVSGELLSAPSSQGSAPVAVRETFIGLHEGLFANTTLRWLYFFSGLLGTAMIATGMVLWIVKRQPAQLKKPNGPDVGYRLVESLNLGTIVGLPIAIAVYFWANRLLPVDYAARADWEVHILFLTWLALLLYPFISSFIFKYSLKRNWLTLLGMATFAYGALPVINALTTERHLANSIANRDWVYIGMETSFIATALLFGVTAYLLNKKWKAQIATPVIEKKRAAQFNLHPQQQEAN